MKRILYVCPSSGVGGAETFILQTMAHCDQSQFENHYLLFRTGPLHDKLVAMGARVHLLNSPPRLKKINDRKRVHNEVKDLINQYNFQLVHSTMAYAALFVAKTCKKMRVPHVWFQHGPASGWMDRLAAILPHQGLIANSHYTGQMQRSLENPLRFLIPRKFPIEKILLGTEDPQLETTDISNFKEQQAQEHGLDDKLPWIGMLCRIQKWKGIHIFVEALAELQKQVDIQDFQAIVWGEAFKDDSYLNDLKKQARLQKLPIFFLGHTDHPSLAMASCDMVVNASIQPEPFGLSIIEGMMVGAVPIVPDEGGPIEIVKNGKNGLLFNSRNPSSLAKQIKKLLLDCVLRKKLSANAQEIAKQKYRATRAIHHLQEFHLRIIG